MRPKATPLPSAPIYTQENYKEVVRGWQEPRKWQR
nr:MAG TPA: hypothetical protein [Caudoviricetes sp.]